MPLLRYRIGDLVRLSDDACPCGRTLPLLASVEGRSQRQYIVTPDGRFVHAVPFAYFMEERQLAGVPIRQFQIVQHDVRTLDVRIVLDVVDDAGFKLMSSQLNDMVCNYYGPEMVCNIVQVEEIIPEPGHKYEYFISLIVKGEQA
jgi:phenylacetate-CoA ligase